jgi:hypothetical protein
MQAKKEHETFRKHPFVLKINVTFRTNKHKKYLPLTVKGKDADGRAYIIVNAASSPMNNRGSTEG